MTLKELLGDLIESGIINDDTSLVLKRGERWARHGFWFGDGILKFLDEVYVNFEQDSVHNTITIYLKEV